ncbi:MAG: hypothetical protein RL563_1112 [Pseudomonadota bacterium]|jgi:soluble lytic murein transglycosylase-like protein
MGLLDSISNLKFEPNPVGMGLLGLGASMLQASNNQRVPIGFGQLLGSGLEGFSSGANNYLAQQMALQEMADKKALQDAQIAHYQALNRKAENGADPYYQVMETSNGLYRFDARTGKYEPLTNNGVPLMKSASDPQQQAAITLAQELNKINQQKLGDGREVPMINSKALGLTGGNTQTIARSLMPALASVESGNNPNAVSSAGARGTYQIMPETAKDPGFGVTPLKDGSEAEQKRFAQDLLAAYTDHFGGDINKGLQAYNMGPGNVEKGNSNQEYANKVMTAAGLGQSTADKAKAEQDALTKASIERETAKAQIDNQSMAEKAKNESMLKARDLLPGIRDQAGNMMSNIDKLLSDQALESVVGKPNWMQSAFLNGSPQANFKQLFQQVTDQSYLAAFQALKGAGAISDQEGKAASNAMARLSTATSVDAFKEAANDLKKVLKSSVNRAYDMAQGKQFDPEELNNRPDWLNDKPSQPKIRRWNPEKGVLE